MGYFMKSDIETLYKAYKNNEISGSNTQVNNAKNYINQLFGGDYQMLDENQQELWTLPFFEEVTLPDGTTDYVLNSPAFDNGYFIYGSVVTSLKNCTATIHATVTQADGSVVTQDWPVSEFVHTKFMLLNAEIVDPDSPSN